LRDFEASARTFGILYNYIIKHPVSQPNCIIFLHIPNVKWSHKNISIAQIRRYYSSRMQIGFNFKIYIVISESITILYLNNFFPSNFHRYESTSHRIDGSFMVVTKWIATLRIIEQFIKNGMYIWMQWKIYLNVKQLVADVHDEGNKYRERHIYTRRKKFSN